MVLTDLSFVSTGFDKYCETHANHGQSRRRNNRVGRAK